MLKKALNRMRNALPTTDFLKKKHRDCANFDNGNCKFFKFTNVDPKGQACPHYKPKKAETD